MIMRSLNKIIEKNKQQHVDEWFFYIENDKTDDRDVDAQDDQVFWVEHYCFGHADFKFCLNCNDMGKIKEDYSNDSQSMEEARIDIKNLFNQ